MTHLPSDERPPSFWRTRFAAGRLVPYARIRHPQYVAFVMILFGFLLQWPTLLTLVMFPILVLMYGRLASHEEAEMRARFGDTFDRYAQQTPRFVPSLRSTRDAGATHA